MAVGQQFIQAYREANQADEVIHLDLYQMDIPQLDADIFSGWGKRGAGVPHEQWSAAEKAKIQRLDALVDQFAAADKYVFVNPIWNYSYPPVMKAYIDCICIAGKTFQYIPGQGRTGLLTGTKAVHIQASGSVLSPGSAGEELEMGHRHLKVIMEFLGVPSFEGIFVEGMAAAPDQASAIRDKAMERAREMARSF